MLGENTFAPRSPAIVSSTSGSERTPSCGERYSPCLPRSTFSRAHSSAGGSVTLSDQSSGAGTLPPASIVPSAIWAQRRERVIGTSSIGATVHFLSRSCRKGEGSALFPSW